MTVEFHPVNFDCNIGCLYCYEHGQRSNCSAHERFSADVLRDVCEDQKKQGVKEIVLHGGEPLLLSIEELSVAFDICYRYFGHTAIQTNATLITEDHIKLFRTFKTHVGVSLDGPGECSRARWGPMGRDKELVEHANRNLRRMLTDSIDVSLIATLWRGNCTSGFNDLVDWFEDLDNHGLKSCRLHFLQGAKSLRVPDILLYSRLVRLSEIEIHFKHLKFDLFREMIDLLAGRRREFTCIWNACNPRDTQACKQFSLDGKVSGCGRVSHKKQELTGLRQDVLWEKKHEDGGCQGCRFFALCKGGCPGTAIDGDWTKRTYDCMVIKSLFGLFEETVIRAGIVPTTRWPYGPWCDNGFKTKEGMDKAHQPIVDAVVKCAKKLDIERPCVCDFGCGNGELLTKIKKQTPIIPMGVDSKREILDKAIKAHPGGTFVLGNVTGPIELDFDIATISVNRLREVNNTGRKKIMDMLRRARFIIFYDYDRTGSSDQLTIVETPHDASV